jgi:outer membrane protein assembly factor BamE (lipoprotein component of BamABCDE complex)
VDRFVAAAELHAVTQRLAAAVFVMLVLVLVAAQWLIPDGLQGSAQALVLGDTGTYAAGYSDRGFRAVRLGMTQAEVLSLLGEPLTKRLLTDSRAGFEFWNYTTSPTNTNFRTRAFVFDPDGRVREKWAVYWRD